MTHATRVTAPRGGSTTETRILVMVGAPGAGKGTQAQRLAARLGLPSVSTGDLFRGALRDDSPLGRSVRPYLERGSLVPDEITVRVIADRLAQPDAAAGIILDGFPRTRAQAAALDALCADRRMAVLAALYIDVELDELVARLGGRQVCGAPESHSYHPRGNPPKVAGRCDVDGTPLHEREDDRPATVRARLREQLAPMYEVVDHYNGTGALCTIAGDQPIDEVTRELVRAVERRSARV